MFDTDSYFLRIYEFAINPLRIWMTISNFLLLKTDESSKCFFRWVLCFLKYVSSRISGCIAPFHFSSFRGIWGAFGPWSWWGWVYNVPNYLYSEIQLSTLNKKVQRTCMSSKSWIGDLEDSGGSWLGFRFLIMMGMGLQCPQLPMFQNSAFYIE